MRNLERTRRIVGGAAFVALLVAALVFYRVAPEPTPTQAAATPSTSAPSASEPAPSAPTVTVTQEEAPAVSDIAEDGPGVSEPGILMLVSPSSDGTVSVSELILLPRPTNAITLRPPDIRRAGSAFEDLSPVARAVQISAGSQPLGVPDGVVDTETTVSISLDDNDAVTTLELRYQLEATAVRSIPSTARRSLAAVAPLITGLPDDLPVVVVASGSSVLSISCPALKGAKVTCGRKTPLGAQTNSPLTLDSAVVTMQFDEPRR